MSDRALRIAGRWLMLCGALVALNAVGAAIEHFTPLENTSFVVGWVLAFVWLRLFPSERPPFLTVDTTREKPTDRGRG